ncbi:MAG: Alcohol dehydrogenase [uncultured Chloroflexi bacterium]|uniref:Alcohol dehydrogenase n=1 Tax=uncultured Chloroflexota bacterium TaxID=166587 RepID=A0A6J4GYB4_9CHLR|nr:MAG: Alcohol dehydrogenase [uncultured Chloroflexota bacterium]
MTSPSIARLPERVPDTVYPFRVPPAQLFGAGAVEQIGVEAKRLGTRHALIVTDPGVTRAGISSRVRELLEAAGISTGTYEEVQPEPTVAGVERAYDATLGAAPAGSPGGYDAIIGVGGGSAMDTAKALSLRSANPGPVSRYFGVELVPNTGLPLIHVPTTAGTGAEITPNAIFGDEERRLKAGVVSHRLFAQVAIVDPDLTLGVPATVTAASGIDALTHAIESYVAVKATPHTDLYALESIRLIAANLRGAVTRGGDRAARTGQALGSFYAGIAITNAGTGLCHAMAYPLGGAYHVPHGMANALLLPAVLEYNMVADLAKMARVAEAMGEQVVGLSVYDAAQRGVEAVRRLCRDVGLPAGLREVGVSEDALAHFVEGALSAARLIDNNPRRPTPEAVLDVYRRSY